MLLTTEEELAGLPQDTRDAAALLAKNKGKDGYLFTLSATSYGPFLKYSSNRELREKMYRAYTTRCTSGEFENTENIRKITALRLQIDKLLGNETYSDMVLSKRMAKNEESVYKLLNDLNDAYRATAMEELKEVQGFAIGKEGQNIELMPCDWSYYSEKLKDAKYEINYAMLQPYFPLESVKKGV